MEIWKDIPSWEGFYQASNLGRIKSLGNGLSNNSKLRILKPGNTGGGYMQVVLRKEGNMKRCKVHRLVALTFLKNPKNKPFINHKDGKPFNNNLDNLEWCTHSENIKHAYNVLGVTCSAKKIKQISKEGIVLKIYKSTVEARNKLGIDTSSITKVCKGKRKTAGGFMWSYL